jgi:hypothetical protein
MIARFPRLLAFACLADRPLVTAYFSTLAATIALKIVP